MQLRKLSRAELVSAQLSALRHDATLKFVDMVHTGEQIIRPRFAPCRLLIPVPRFSFDPQIFAVSAAGLQRRTLAIFRAVGGGQFPQFTILSEEKRLRWARKGEAAGR